MNDRILYNSSILNGASSELKELMRVLSDVESGLDRVNTSEEWWGKVSVRISGGARGARTAVRTLRSSVGKAYDRVSDIQIGINRTIAAFDATDQKIVQAADRASQGRAYEDSGVMIGQYRALTGDSLWDRFRDEFAGDFDWDVILGGAGYIGTIYDFIQDIKNGKSWWDFGKTGMDIYQFLHMASITYSNYQRVGRMVGKDTAAKWWLKRITGIRPLGRASSAESFRTRFINNLTNKTSPYNAQIREIVGDFKGANGVGRTVAAWAGVVADGIFNWFDNKAEQAASGGKMSDGRVLAETVTETAVGTVLSYGMGIVVGAAVTAALGTVAAPGVVVVALTGLAVMGINAGVKALTGKTATEFVSDVILDSAEKLGKAIGDGVKAVGDTVGKWFEKLSFA